VAMKVDFNNVRIAAVDRYNQLTEILNEKIDSRGVIESFDADEIQGVMDALRTNLVIIAASFEDGNNDFIDVCENLNFVDFNPAIYEEG
jgi:hypothetical protein